MHRIILDAVKVLSVYRKSAGFEPLDKFRRYLKKRILVQDQGGREVQTAVILPYFEDLNRAPNKDIGPKDFFEMISIRLQPLPMNGCNHKHD